MEYELNHSISTSQMSKLDKAQAKRLKMPKRNRSAYFLFSMDTRAKLRIEFSNNLTPLETQAKVSQYWKELSPEEKEKYEQRAKEEKLEYLTAMDKFYSNLTPETIAKSKTNRPKKPCSAYAHFVRDIKTDLKKENPRLIMQEILHIVSDKWKNLSSTARAVYEERAKVDKEQYMTAIKKLSPSKQEGEKLGKRAMKMTESSEKTPTKQVKLESISTKSESQGETDQTTYKLVKIEESVSNSTGSPLSNSNAFNLETIAPMETVNMNFQGLQMPGLNENMLRRQAMYQNPYVGGDYEKMKEMMLAKLSWERLVQTNQSLEHAIVRRIAEVRTLQAQQMLFAQRVLLASNVGGAY